jgi:citrate synthase
MSTVVPGLAGVPVSESSISYIDGQRGLLEYRGFPIETLAARSNFEEVAWLLLYGRMPTRTELDDFCARLGRARALPDRLVQMIAAMPGAGHPMDALQASIVALAMFEAPPDWRDPASVDAACVRILAATPVMVATFERLRRGKDLVPPRAELSTAANFLWMMTGVEPAQLAARVFDVALLLHADHEQNASTFAGRVVASTEAGPYTVCSSAIGALHGPLHGGANEEVLEALQDIGSPERVPAWLDAKLATGGKVMGFGHRVYKVKDPRATILQGLARQVFDELGSTPLYETALALEREMHSRFAQKGIYPNVDFFSGFVYAKLGIPTDQFTPVFGISRVAGYLAHWLEQRRDNKLFRPGQVYTGSHGLSYPELGARG